MILATTTLAASLVAIASVLVVGLGTVATFRASGAATAALTLVALGIGLALATFDVNCTFEGQCSVYGWLKAALLLLYLSAALALEVKLLTQDKENKK